VWITPYRAIRVLHRGKKFPIESAQLLYRLLISKVMQDAS